MSSLKDDFDELIRRIKHGRELSAASFEPIYYLVFPPKRILEVKRSTPAWTARLHKEGWDVKVVSIRDKLTEILHADPLWDMMLEQDKQSPLAWDETNASLANVIGNGTYLADALLEELDKISNSPKGLLLVTDLEALHPLTRIGVIESKLHGSFHIPTIFFYPGTRTGKTRLKFLGFYPENGNYRSVHVGG